MEAAGDHRLPPAWLDADISSVHGQLDSQLGKQIHADKAELAFFRLLQQSVAREMEISLLDARQ